MITLEIKKQIILKLADQKQYFSGSDKKFALSLGISAPQYSRIKNGETESVLSEPVWISLARRCNVQIGNSIEWNTAVTPFFQFVTAQLTFCQTKSASRILCDIADIGKTHTAVHYAKSNKNVAYIDCSQYKSKQKLIKAIAQAFGVPFGGTYNDVYADLVYYLRQLPMPLIILDEAGDLEYNAWLELKALWNATEGVCGWYMMGADGLQTKIDARIQYRKVGYTEIFSRFGNKYQKATPGVYAGKDEKPKPATEQEMKKFKAAHAAMIVKVNFPVGTNIPEVIASAGFTLRNLKDERKKLAA